MLYQAYQAHADIMGPVRKFAGMAARTVAEQFNGSARPALLNNLTAAYELIARAGLTHVRPPYGIDAITIDGQDVAVSEEAVEVTPFGTLLHFKKPCRRCNRASCWSLLSRDTSRRCCVRPCAPCWRSTMSTSLTGTMRATFRLSTCNSAYRLRMREDAGSN